MNFESYAAVAFVIILAILVYAYRHKLTIQKVIFPLIYIAMLRTTIGISLMDRIAKRLPRILKWTGHAGVIVGFAGMILIIAVLFDNLWKLLFVPAAIPGVAVIQPFAKDIPGTFFVPFFYFIISIFVLAFVHEFSHGVIAHLYGIKVKHSGVAILSVLLPVIPAAFVEPEEKVLRRRPAWQQLSVFAAGPFSNIVCAVLVLLLVAFAVNPAVSMIIKNDGVEVSEFFGNGTYPAERAGLKADDHIVAVDDIPIETIRNFTDALSERTPGEKVVLHLNDSSSYPLTLVESPDEPEKGYMGIFVKQHTSYRQEFIDRFGKAAALIIMWIAGLFLWLYVLNIGIGLFNLLPLPIVDGGRMMEVFLKKVLPKKRAEVVWYRLGIFFFLLILVNLVLGFVR